MPKRLSSSWVLPFRREGQSVVRFRFARRLVQFRLVGSKRKTDNGLRMAKQDIFDGAEKVS